MNHSLIENSGVLGIPAAALPSAVKEINAINYTIVASTALLLWDILLTFDREVRYIWKSKFSLIVVVFGVIRLLAVGGQIVFLVFNLGVMSVTHSFCRSAVWFQGMLGLIMFTFIDILLIFRVYALYGRNKMLLSCLCIAEAVAFMAVIGLFALALPKFQVTPNPFPRQLRVGSCIPLSYPNIEPDIWIPILPIQAILFNLAVGRYIYLRWKGPTMFKTTFNIYYTFTRDGIWIFFALLLVILMCVIGNNLQNVLGPVAIQWCYSVIGICASRAILNLRSASGESHNHSLEVSLVSTKVNFFDGSGGTVSNKNNSEEDFDESV